jgi:hypothetical protein
MKMCLLEEEKGHQSSHDLFNNLVAQPVGVSTQAAFLPTTYVSSFLPKTNGYWLCSTRL